MGGESRRNSCRRSPHAAGSENGGGRHGRRARLHGRGAAGTRHQPGRSHPTPVDRSRLLTLAPSIVVSASNHADGAEYPCHFPSRFPSITARTAPVRPTQATILERDASSIWVPMLLCLPIPRVLIFPCRSG